MAALELERYVTLLRAKRKLRSALLWYGRMYNKVELKAEEGDLVIPLPRQRILEKPAWRTKLKALVFVARQLGEAKLAKREQEEKQRAEDALVAEIQNTPDLADMKDNLDG